MSAADELCGAHGPAEDHSDHGHALTGNAAGPLRAAFAITAGVLVLELVGGWITGSVALLADAGHMLTDAGALGIALFAAWAAAQPRLPRHSFGYGRAEVLAALLNGLLLGGVSVGIAIESFAFRPCLRAASSALSLSMNSPIGSTEVVRTSGSISTLMSRAVTIALFLAFTE